MKGEAQPLPPPQAQKVFWRGDPDDRYLVTIDGRMLVGDYTSNAYVLTQFDDGYGNWTPGIRASRDDTTVQSFIAEWGAWTSDNPVRPSGQPGQFNEYINGEIVCDGETILLIDGQFDHIINDYEP